MQLAIYFNPNPRILCLYYAYYEPPAGMPSSHLLVLVRAHSGMRAGPKKAGPHLRGRPQLPGPAGPRPGGAAVLYN